MRRSTPAARSIAASELCVQRALHKAPWQFSVLKSYTAECPGLPAGFGTAFGIMKVAELPPWSRDGYVNGLSSTYAL